MRTDAVDEARTLCDDILGRVKSYRSSEESVHLHRGLLEAMGGSFDYARTPIAHGRPV
jgi:hypothetical protein